MASYTSEYSGGQIDEAVFFGYKAKDIGNTFVSRNIDFNAWGGSTAPHTYTYNPTNAFSYCPMVFFVGENGDRIDLDYNVNMESNTITVYSNKKLALTMVVCG